MSKPTFTFSLISAIKKHMEIDNVTGVFAPTREGEIGILANHEPIVSALSPGILRIESTTRTSKYAIGPGVLETDGNILTILADMVDDADDLNIDVVAQKKEEARAMMLEAQNKGLQSTSEYIGYEQEYLKQSALEKLARDYI